MPPRKRLTSVPIAPSSPEKTLKRAAITAAAAVTTGAKISRPELNKKDGDWQAEVWLMYDQIGELHFALRWKAQACSRLKLVAAHNGPDPEPIVLDDDTPDSSDDVKALQVAESLAGGAHAQSKMLRAGAIPVDAVGEAFIVMYAETGLVRVFAPNEIKNQQGKWLCGNEEIADEDLVIHARMSHPADCLRVDSSVRSALPVLRELHGLNQQLLGAIDSRLAGAGLLVVPNSISPPRQPPTDEDESGLPDNERDEFIEALIQAMMTSISDRESAASVVPLVVRVPDDMTDKIQHIIFAQPFDPELRNLRDEAIRRLGIELDMPPEILLGVGDVNHWGQWAIDESAIKFNIVPTAQVLVDPIIHEWYWPALEQVGIEDPTKYTLLIDASELEQRVDKSGNAKDLYDRVEITGEALRRENGFSPEDAPTPVQQAKQIALMAAVKGASASAEPAPGEADDDAPVDQTRAIPEMPDEPPAPDETPAAAALETPPELRMLSLTDAAHVAVFRALEMAGKRHISQDRARRGSTVPLHLAHTEFAVEAEKLDLLMDGAWTALATIAEPCFIAALDDYTRELLTAGMEHKRDYLAAVFTRAACDG